MRAEQDSLDRTDLDHSYQFKSSGPNSDIDWKVITDLVSSDVMTALTSGCYSINIPLKREDILSTRGARDMLANYDAIFHSSIKKRQQITSGNVNGLQLKQGSSKHNEHSPETLLEEYCSLLVSSGNNTRPHGEYFSRNPVIKTEAKDSVSINSFPLKASRRHLGEGSARHFDQKAHGRKCMHDFSNITESSNPYLSTADSDPFIPPPISPVVEDSHPFNRNNHSCSPLPERSISDTLPIAGENSNFIRDSSSSSQVSIRVPSSTDKSLPFPTETLHEPVLFKELSCNNLEQVSVLSSANPACSSFSAMSSSRMQSLQTSSSILDNEACYTELSSVTSDSLYSDTIESQELSCHDQEQLIMSGTHLHADKGQNGISSMLPPLIASGRRHHTSSPLPTYSTLMSAVTSHPSQIDISPVGHHNTLDSCLSSTASSEALKKLSLSQIDTALITKQVRDKLVRHGICQRIFGERILGLSQGTVSDILSHPKPWGKLTQKGKEPFTRMILWLSDRNAGGLLPSYEAVDQCEQLSHSSSSISPCAIPVNLSRNQGCSHPSSKIEGLEQFASLSPSQVPVPSPHSVESKNCVSPEHLNPIITPSESLHVLTQFGDSKPNSHSVDQSENGHPITPLQQMLNIQELAASCPKLDTIALTRKVKDLLTEHNIGQRIFGQAVLGLTQGSVSDLLSRPKLWRSLSLKGREPFVRMQLWLSDPNSIEQLKSLKLERWMEKKWGGKRHRNDGGSHNLSSVKKQRIVLSSDEKEVLRRAYGIEPYPSQETVDLLAAKLGRKSSTIVNWFHNYRSRVKRGFFPGEELQDLPSKKRSGCSKLTVRQLLEGIMLPSQPSSMKNDNLKLHNSIFSKTGNDVCSSMKSKVHGSNRATSQVLESHRVCPQTKEPMSVLQYHIKDESKINSINRHYQESQSIKNAYSNSMMPIKEEGKLIELDASDAIFSLPFQYSAVNSITHVLKSQDNCVSNSVSIVAPACDNPASHASSVSEKMVNSVDKRHHHEGYPAHNTSFSLALASKVPVSSESHQANSILPPVHTLTPKKGSFGSALSNLALPSASSLLHPSFSPLHSSPVDANFSIACSQPQRLANLARPRSEALPTRNNNMNNNSVSCSGDNALNAKWVSTSNLGCL